MLIKFYRKILTFSDKVSNSPSILRIFNLGAHSEQSRNKGN